MSDLHEAAELEALRSKVVVVPERKYDPRGGLGSHARGYNACLDELARLNGKTVSESLLRRLCTMNAVELFEASRELRALLDAGKEDGNG